MADAMLKMSFFIYLVKAVMASIATILSTMRDTQDIISFTMPLLKPSTILHTNKIIHKIISQLIVMRISISLLFFLF